MDVFTSGLFMVGKENKKTKEGGKESGGEMSQQQQQQTRSSKLLGQLFGNKGSDKIAESAGGAGSGSERKAFEKRRTIGATTIPLDARNFTAKPTKPKHPQDVSTGDMWRTLKPISSGISGSEERVRIISFKYFESNNLLLTWSVKILCNVIWKFLNN